MFMTTFRSIQTRRNVIREDLKLCKERRERRHLQNDRSIYIYEHEAIRRPKSENNIGAPSAPQKNSLVDSSNACALVSYVARGDLYACAVTHIGGVILAHAQYLSYPCG